MLISHIVTQLREDLARLGRLGGDEMATTASNLAEAAAPALRERLFEALDQLVAEANADNPNLRLEMRLAGDDVRLVREEADVEPVEAPSELNARFALRLPEELKSLVDDRANRAGASTNSWIIRALSKELSESQARSSSPKGRHLRGTGRS